MKKIITTLAMAMVVSGYAQPQTKKNCCEKRPSPDAELISQNTKGGYKICKWRVSDNPPDQSNGYDVKYNINASHMTKGYDNNEMSLQEVRSFLDTLTKCKCSKITMIKVIGHASPDGIMAENKKLAVRRAQNFYDHISEEYNLSKYPSSVSGIALPWSGIKSSVMDSNVPNKSSVVDIITSKHSESAIESKLRDMPTTWSYLCKNILPQYRTVELQISYDRWKIVTTRSAIQPMEIAVVEEVVAPRYYVIMPPEESEIIAFENRHSQKMDYDKTIGRYMVKEKRDKDKEREEIKTLWGTIKGRYKVKR